MQNSDFPDTPTVLSYTCLYVNLRNFSALPLYLQSIFRRFLQLLLFLPLKKTSFNQSRLQLSLLSLLHLFFFFFFTSSTLYVPGGSDSSNLSALLLSPLLISSFPPTMFRSLLPRSSTAQSSLRTQPRTGYIRSSGLPATGFYAFGLSKRGYSTANGACDRDLAAGAIFSLLVSCSLRSRI